ncbi:MAG: hypothetical protein J0M18_05600 [Ignavibacteria bacterium]|nr:hypothetical protein [Ignavibacteria bacterium]
MQPRFTQVGKVENKFLNHFLLYLLMGVSSMPILFGNEFLIAGFVLTTIIFIMKSKRFDRVIVSYNLVFLALFGLHLLAYDKFILGIIVAYFMRIYFAYFTVKIIGKDIDKYIVNQIYFFSIISLIITFLIFINPSLADFIYSNITPVFDKITLFQPNRQHFIIYTMELGYKVEIPRNSGPFWEPGGFSVFLFIALTFNLIRDKKFFNKKNTIFLIALLTTQSTTAYLAFFIFVCIYILISYRSIYSFIMMPVLIFIFLNLYTNLNFMEEKVDKMYKDSQKAGTEKVYSRIVSGKINMENFYSSPIFGIGRFFQVADDQNTGNNGTTLLLAEFGAVGFGYYFIMMFLSYRKYCRRYNFNSYFPLAIIAGLLVLGYSQGIFQKPFFMALCFMFMVKFDNQESYAATLFKNRLPVFNRPARLVQETN